MTVKITITGPRGSGKTTAASKIAAALSAAGFKDFQIEDVHGDNVHPGLPVAGYKTQPSEAVVLVNQNKYREERILRIMDGLKNDQDPQGMSITVDQRWLAIARTHIEEGFMALNRSIFQPQRIEGEI